MTAEPEGEPGHVQRLVEFVWPNLAMILVSSTIVCAGGISVLFIGRGITPISLLLWGLVVGPLFAALLAQVSEAFHTGMGQQTFSFFHFLVRAWKPGLIHGCIPGAAAALCLVALEVFHLTASWVVLVPFVLSGSAAALACLAYGIALPLRFALPHLRGRVLLLTSLHIAARKPVPFAGVVALIVIVAFVSAQFSAALIFLLPGPLAVVLVAAVWTAAHGIGLDPPKSGGESH